MSNDSTDLKRAVREKLEGNGTIHELKARIRAEIFQSIEDKTFPLPDKPPEVYLAFQLIKEFLDSLNLKNTSSVFVEEVGLQKEVTDRDFIASELGFHLTDSSQAKSVPLLLSLIQILQNQKNDGQNSDA